jgi:integrase
MVIERSLCQTKKSGLLFKLPKNKKERFVPLPGAALEALERHRQEQEEFRKQFGPDYRKDLDLIFANPDGSPLRPDSISAAVSRYCRLLKLPKGANLHALRHTHGSHLLAAGVDLPKVSERLGHSSVYVTATIYAHVLKDKDERETVRKWEEYQRKAKGDSGPPDAKPV